MRGHACRGPLALVPVACAVVGARHASAQTPTPPPAPRRDTLPTTPSDSAARDSAVTQMLALDSARARNAGTVSLRLDRLRLQTAGATFGWVWPGQAVATNIYSLHADYGEVLPGVRLLFVSSYWATRYTDLEVERLASEVQRAAAPSRADTLQLGRIRVSDLSAGPDLRWQPGVARQARRAVPVLQPWFDGSLAVHLVNVDGAPVSGTFIERALDAASLGVGAGFGMDVHPVPNVQLTASARYDFVGTVRYGSVRLGGAFVFGPATTGRER